MKPQVLLSFSPSEPLVAGARPALRTAFLFQGELQAERILLCRASFGDLAGWTSRLGSLPWLAVSSGGPALPGLIAPGRPLLWVAPGALPERRSLERFLRSARRRAEPTKALSGNRLAAVYFPDSRALLGRLSEGCRFVDEKSASADVSASDRIETGDWRVIESPADAAQAEADLFADLPQPSDGYLARWDRRLSIALSKRLMRYPVTPNQITSASLFLGLAGAWLIAAGDYPAQVAGAFFLWFCAILDGCDGEIARLKLMSSPAGARYDVAADHVAHLAVFLALPLHLHRKVPGASFLFPGAVLVSGVLLSMFWVWKLLLRSGGGGAARQFFERVASRDYVYVILALTLLGKLEWFLWGAAGGSHVFWIGLLLLSSRGAAA